MTFAPPTLVATYPSAWNATTPKSVSVTAAAGDMLVILATSVLSTDILTLPTGGTGITYYEEVRQEIGGFSNIYCFSAAVPTAQTFNLSVTNASTDTWGFIVLRFVNSSGIGVTASSTGSGAPSQTLSTLTPGSSVVCLNADINAVNGSTRTWRTIGVTTPTAGNGFEVLYNFVSTVMTSYAAYWPNIGSLGAGATVTTGLTAPTGQAFSILAVEVLPLVNTNFPLTVTSVAFSTDPFDNTATPSYVDISNRVEMFDASVGKQYELDTGQAGEATYTLYDPDEALNPINTGGPFYPNIKIYRAIADQAMWPNQTFGNLLNTNYGTDPVLGTINGYDPSFESYANGSSVPWILTTGGVTPTITTTNPHSGTQSLTYSVLGNSIEQGVGLTIPTIPGRQYTVSMYVRQTAANTSVIFISAGAGGTSTTTTAAYVRLHVTFTASLTYHQVWMVSFTPTLASTVNIDDIQYEQGQQANVFTTSGPSIFGVFAGFVERWPNSWNFQGTYGMAQITCVDAFAPMAGQFLDTEYRNAVLAKSPDYYWTLGEAQGATSFADISGNLGPSVQFLSSIYGAGVLPAAGTATGIAGDPNGTGVKITADQVNSLNQQTTILVVGNIGAGVGGLSNNPPIVWPKNVTPPFGASMALFINNTNPPNGGSIQEFLLAAFGNVNTGGGATVTTMGGATATWSGFNIQDGNLHLIICTFASSGGTETVHLWVDNNLVATGTAAAGTYPAPGGTYMEIGGFFAFTTQDWVMNGTISHIALWSRTLSNFEIADLWNAKLGYLGENSGARFTRYMGYQYITPSIAETGQSSMGVSNLANNTSLLDATQSVTTSENGTMYVGKRGVVEFQSRTHRYLEITPKWVFGENQAGGEIPYLGDLVFDYDPTQVYNDVQVTNSGGVVAQGGAVTDITTSRKRYGKRSYARTINVQSNNEAQDAANWIFYGHRDPIQRIEQVTVDLAANPSLFLTVLAIRISDRVTLKRRTTVFTMQADFYIERIEHSRGPNKWQVIFQMSPVLTRQPWILGDATYGVLDSTTVLGY